MKKISLFNVLLLVAAILFAGASLTACGDDKDKDNPEGGGGSDTPSVVSPIVGTWVNVASLSQPSYIDALVFYADGKFIIGDVELDAQGNVDHAAGYVGNYAVKDTELTLNTTKAGAFDAGWMSDPKWEAWTNTEEFLFKVVDPGQGVTKDYQELHLLKNNVETAYIRKDIDNSFIQNCKKQLGK